MRKEEIVMNGKSHKQRGQDREGAVTKSWQTPSPAT
jgi:hypothetical protein